MHIGSWTAVLAAFWVLLSGYFQPLLLTFGFLSVALVLVIVKRMDAIDQELKDLKLGLATLRYIPWLLKEIVLSAIKVTKCIWVRQSQLSPALSRISVLRVPPNKQVLFANSITLTPGTLCVDLDEEMVTIHALNAASIDELEQGSISEKISELWGDQA